MSTALRFLGAAGTVTGSCYEVRTTRCTFLVDCGMFQGPPALQARNHAASAFDPATIDFVLLTHAHIDHSGLLPLLVKRGFKGHIFATAATRDLCEILLHDSAHLQHEASQGRDGAPEEPLYDSADVRQTLSLFHPVPYDTEFSPGPGIRCRLQDAGHILGSAFLEVWTGDREGLKLAFSGDLGHIPTSILRDPARLEEADIVLLESTYGDREHESYAARAAALAEAVNETDRMRGVLLVPSFAVGRTQELLYELGRLLANREIPHLPLFLDSPMAQEVTGVFRRYPHSYDSEMRDLLARGADPLSYPGQRFTRSVEESKWLNTLDGPAIIIAGNGMCTGGRVVYHLKRRLGHPQNTLLFVGYQAEGTTGREILEGASSVEVAGSAIPVRASVRSIEGFSAHAGQSELLTWVGRLRRPPKRVFVTHGEHQAATTLRGLIETRLGWPATVAEWKQEVALA